MSIQKKIKKAYKSSKPYSRNFYKNTGLQNPIEKGSLSFTKLLHDVNILKEIINSEKKRVEVKYNGSIGQVDSNGNGYYAIDITPLAQVGTSYDGRTGASIKVHSGIIQLQILAQANQDSPMRGRVLIFKVDQDNTIASADFCVKEYLDWNPFVGSGTEMVDYFSLRNPDNFTKYQQIIDKKWTLKADNHSNERMITDITIPLRFNSHHVKYEKNSNTIINSGRIIMVILCDSGNRNTTTASTLSGVPVTAANTGAFFHMFTRFNYYDN